MNLLQLLFFAVLAALAFVVMRPLLFGKRVSAADAAAQVADGTAVLVDVREPAEWRSGVAAPASLLSLSDLRGERRQWERFLDANKDKLLILYCASGMRSGVAGGILRKEGHRVANLGGFGRWVSAGLPVREP